ncbi:MAG: helix-hairpin-helix domain-containing protein [Phycisphaeraceae bacterium]
MSTSPDQPDRRTRWRYTPCLWAGLLGMAWTMLGLAYFVRPAPPPAAPAETAYRLRINEADAARLTLLPGVGTHIAEHIVARRRLRPFERAEQLEQVPWIGERTRAGMEPWIHFDVSSR